MSMFPFGELRQVSSRAYDDEEDEDISEPPSEYNVILQVSDSFDRSSLVSSKALLVAYGSLMNDFVKALFSESCEDVGSIVIDQAVSSDEAIQHLLPSRLHFHPQLQVLVCCVSKDVNPSIAVQFSSKILSLVNAECPILSLSSHHYCALQGGYNPRAGDTCVVHSLASPSFFPYKPVYLPLPQPAVIDSVPAAVMTECIVSKRACVLYCVFTETLVTGDVDIVAPSLMSVFDSDPFCMLSTLKLNRSRLEKLKSLNPRNDIFNLYM